MEKVKDNGVKALSHAYIVNTISLGVCNSRLQGLIDFYKAQGALYNDAANK